MFFLNKQKLDKNCQVFVSNFRLNIIFTFLHLDESAHLHMSLYVVAMCHLMSARSVKLSKIPQELYSGTKYFLSSKSIHISPLF